MPPPQTIRDKVRMTSSFFFMTPMIKEIQIGSPTVSDRHIFLI